MAGTATPAPRRRRHQLARDRRALPHQRPEPRDRGGVHAPRRAVQGRRRHPLLRPPRGQGRDGLPAGGRQPGRRGQRQAGAQRAQARRRRRQHRQARRVRRGRGRSPFVDALRRADDAGVTGPAVRGIASFVDLLDRLGDARRRRRRGSRRPAAGGARGLRLPRRARGRGHRRGARTDREPRRARRVGPRVHRARRVPRAGVARRRHRRPRRRRPGRADDAALGQGSRVPGRVPRRRRGGRSSRTSGR